MNIQVESLKNADRNTVLYPVLKNDETKNIIETIAKQTGVDAVRLNEDFKGNLKEVHSFYGNENSKIFLLGLGDSATTNEYIQTCRSFAHKHKSKLPESITVDLATTQTANQAEYILIGLALGKYDIQLYKTIEKTAVAFSNIVVCVDKADQENTKKITTRALQIVNTLFSVFDLINKPANKKRPQEMAKWALKSGKENNYSVRILDKAEIEKEGLHALLAVNRGSEDPAKFIICEYIPKNKNVKKIGLVGKGVTFDTGGLSIKPSSNMHLMKSDMGGSGAVLGAIELAAKFGVQAHIMAVVGATDNSVDSLSYKPSDVISSYAGKTIEIIDTDAEGRLTLADGLAYVNKNFEPDILIDIATLTGAVIRALGYEAAGLYTKSDDLAQQLTEAGDETGERLWRFPMWDSYGSMIKSDIADVRNYSGKPIAGSITAAKFLEHFTNEHKTWAHLDIAGTSVTSNEFSSDRSATGFGVRLLLQFIENIAVNK